MKRTETTHSYCGNLIKRVSLDVRSRDAAITSGAKAMEVACKALDQAEQSHAKVLKNLKELQSENQKVQGQLSVHDASMESLHLALLTQAITFEEEVRAQSLDAAMKAHDGRISKLQKTIRELA